MDPTAPGNNNQNPQAPQSPIQPGQFVVAGESAPQPVPAEVAPVVNLAQSTQPTPPQTPPIGGPTQPDPTPFTPPGPVQNTPAAPPSQAGGGSKMKIVLILLAVIVLIAIIGALVWFFVLNKPSTTDTSTSLPEQQIEEPATPPQRTDGGFGELPATDSASVASPPAQTTLDQTTIDPTLNP